ncbi:MAG: hypothetical protein QXT63_05715, partial [Thermoplasmata archaeon]
THEFEDISIFSNQSITLDLATHVFDPEGEAISWNVTSEANGTLFIIALDGNNLTVTPTECSNGTANITILASDTFGNSVEFTFNLTVFSSCTENNPPQLFPFLDICLLSNETEIVSVVGHGSDPDGDTLKWYVTETSELFDIEFDGKNITILPFECANGTGLVLVYLSDGLVNVSTSFKVVILNNCSGGNRPPLITGLSDISILSNQTFNLDLTLHGSDPDGDSLTWFANETSPLIEISLSNNILAITPAECANGTAYIYLRLSDDKGAFRTAEIKVRITNACIPIVHLPPRLKPIPDQTIEGNNVITIPLIDYAILGSDKNPIWYLAPFDENAVNVSLDYTSKTIKISRVSRSSAHAIIDIKLIDSLGYVAEGSINVTVKEIKYEPKPTGGTENQFCILFGVIALIAALIVALYLFSRRRNIVKVTTIDVEPTVTQPQTLQSQGVEHPSQPSQANQAITANMVTAQKTEQKEEKTIEARPVQADTGSEDSVPVAATEVAEAKAVAVDSGEVKTARPVASAVAVETDEEVAVAKTVFSLKGKKGKKGKNVDALRREYEELESRISKLSKSKNAQEKEKYENALRLAGTYAKASNFEKAISILKKAEGK